MTSSNVPEIEELIKIISKLPGLGPKSAKRIILKLIKNREELIKPLTNTLAKVYKNIARCNICGNLKSKNLDCVCFAYVFNNRRNHHNRQSLPSRNTRMGLRRKC